MALLEELAHARQAAHLTRHSAALVGRCNHHNAAPLDATCCHPSCVELQGEYKIFRCQTCHCAISLLRCLVHEVSHYFGLTEQSACDNITGLGIP